MNSKSYKLVTESRRRDEKIASSSHTIDAAALQSEMAQRFKLPGFISNKVSHRPSPSSRIQNTINLSELPRLIVCPSCQKSNERMDVNCSHCGYFFPVISSNNIPSLAQKRGLIKISEKQQQQQQQKVIPKTEWDYIESMLMDREDAYCPICMIGFNQSYEVLLSCSHMFHNKCLQAFEKFMKSNERSCPICRTHNYQKKITTKGSRSFEVVCIRKIQALWRGYCARKLYYSSRKKYYKTGQGNQRLRKEFYQKELTSYTNMIITDINERETAIDNMLSSTDMALEESRKLNLLFDTIVQQRQVLAIYHDSSERNAEHYSISNSDNNNNNHHHHYHHQQHIDWDDITKKSLIRGVGDCAICMCPNQTIPYRPIILLSCTHLFHHQCIENFERFCEHSRSHHNNHRISSLDDNSYGQENLHGQMSCPVCRKSGYEKKVLDQRIVRTIATLNMLTR